MSDDTRSRRSVLGMLGGALGVTTLGTGTLSSSVMEALQSDGAPAVEWYEHYQGIPEEYQLPELGFLFETDDGYGIVSSGAEVTKTGAENETFALLKVADGGDKQWVKFVDPEREYSNHDTTGAARTSDGGYGFVGTGTVTLENQPREGSDIALAAKADSDGATQWTATVDALDGEYSDTGPGPYAAFYDAAPTDDGGLVAVGNYNDAEWFVRFGPDGEITDQHQYEDQLYVTAVFDEADGYLLVGHGEEGGGAIQVSETGAVQDRFTLDAEAGDDEIHGNPTYIRTEDGGFAYGGGVRHSNGSNFLLGRLDAAGEYQWSQQYTGPFEGYDYFSTLIQTVDGGFALTGSMEEAYSGDSRPAVVKTGADGTEEWELLLDEANGNSADDLIQTNDRGLLVEAGQQLFKLGATDDPTTETPTESPTKTSSPTPTQTPDEGPSDPSTEPPTESPDTGSGDEAETPADERPEDCPEDEE